MKKILYSIAALGTVLFASCADDMFEKSAQQSDNKITFTIEELASRATPINDKTGLFDAYETMKVKAYNSKELVINDKFGSDLLTSVDYFWPTSNTPYDFYVQPDYAEACGITTGINDVGNLTFTYDMSSLGLGTTNDNGAYTDAEKTPDVVFAVTKGVYKEEVALNFMHALSYVTFEYQNPAIAHKVSQIEIKNATKSANGVFTGTGYTWSGWSQQNVNLKQTIDKEVKEDNEESLQHVNGGNGEAATFMLIPGGDGEDDEITFEVTIDNGKVISTTYPKSSLTPGEYITVTISDNATELFKHPTPGVGGTKTYTSREVTVDGVKKTVYDLTIESFVTGSQKTVTSVNAADIVVLVDLSGSMEYDMASGTKVPYEGNWTYNNYNQTTSTGDTSIKGTYYCKFNNEFYEVEHGGKSSNRYLYFTVGGTTYYLSGDHTAPTTTQPKGYGSNDVIWKGTLYRCSRLDATKTALKAFVENVYENGSSNDVDHYIAIASFQGSSATEVKGWTSLTGDRETLLNSINSSIDAMVANNGTPTGTGMNKVKNYFDNKGLIDSGERENASNIVVVLTDGDPSSTTQGNSALSTSNTLKGDTYAAKVWSVFVGDDMSNTAKNFMPRLSSNYTGSTNYNNGTKAADKYSVVASDEESLTQIFSTITEDVGDGAGVNFSTEETVLKDIISSVFVVPADADTEHLVLQVENYNNQGVYSNTDAALNDVKATIENGELTITGFDYSTYFWGEHSDSDIAKGIVGKKLIITLKDLELADGLDEDKVYFTNGGGSGLWTKDDKGNDVFYPFQSSNTIKGDGTLVIKQ